MTEAFEASSTAIRGLSRSIQERQLSEKVAGQLAGLPLEAFREPTKERWWPGRVYEAISLACIKVSSPEVYEDLCLSSTRQTFGPFVSPMVKVTLGIVGVTPAGLLSQMSMLALTAIRGPTFKWVAAGKTAGALTVTYLAPTEPSHTLHSWRATIRYAFEMTMPGTIRGAVADNTHQTFVFDVTW